MLRRRRRVKAEPSPGSVTSWLHRVYLEPSVGCAVATCHPHNLLQAEPERFDFANVMKVRTVSLWHREHKLILKYHSDSLHVIAPEHFSHKRLILQKIGRHWRPIEVMKIIYKIGSIIGPNWRLIWSHDNVLKFTWNEFCFCPLQ